MQTSVRTTFRIRKDLLIQSKLLAVNLGTTVAQVINDALAAGFGKISDLNLQKEAMVKIDAFREGINIKVNTAKLLKESKKFQR